MKLETKHFLIICNFDEKIIPEFSELIEKEYARIYEQLRKYLPVKKPQKKIRVILCKTFREYSVHVKKHYKLWRKTQGWGHHNQGIILNLKRIVECGNFTEGDYEFIKTVYVLEIIGHEIFHVFTTKHFPPKMPCWLNEGLAEYIGGNIKKIAPVKNPVRFSDESWNPRSYQFDYNQATNTIICLAKKYGEKSLFLFLKKYLRTKNFDQAFLNVYKKEFKKIEEDLIKTKYQKVE